MLAEAYGIRLDPAESERLDRGVARVLGKVRPGLLAAPAPPAGFAGPAPKARHG